MYFEQSVYPQEVPALFNRFVAIPGWTVWKRRLAGLHQQIRSNPLLEQYFYDRYRLELEFAAVVSEKSSLGRFPPVRPSQLSFDRYRLFEFVAMIARVHQRLSRGGKNRLEGMLRDSLKDEKGLAPIAFEMEMAGHLMRQGFDVEFQDIENGGCDFVVRREDVALDVECKNVSGDLGRQIHQRRMVQLAGNLSDTVRRVLKRQGGKLVRVTLPERLRGEQSAVQAIAAQIGLALDEERNVNSSLCDVILEEFDFTATPFASTRPPNYQDVAHLLERQLGLNNPSALFAVSPGRAALVVHVQSREPNAVAKGLYRQLSAATNQLSRVRSGLVCVRFSDMTDRQILDLAQDGKVSALQVLTSKLFHDPDHRHVHTIAYTTSGRLESGRWLNGDQISSVWHIQGPAFTFINPKNSHAADDRYAVFRS